MSCWAMYHSVNWSLKLLVHCFPKNAWARGKGNTQGHKQGDASAHA